MLVPAKLGPSLLWAFTAYVLYKILKAFYGQRASPLRNLPGPKSSHWFHGNMRELRDDEDLGLQEGWVQTYGRTLKFHQFLGRPQLFTTDTKALHHILSRTDIYQKPPGARITLGSIVGPGVLVVENEQHKQQRKIMNPAFGAPQVRALTSIFVDTSIQLRDIWAAQVPKDGGVARVEIIPWLNKATPGHHWPGRINALAREDSAPPDELTSAFQALLTAETDFTFLRLLQIKIPLLRCLPTKSNIASKESQATLTRIGMKLLADSKREIAENGTFETGNGRDLLTLLVRANTSKEIPVSQRMSDEDVIAQVPTYLVAGHETTSTALTWALFSLTQNVAAQTRLREELLSVSTDKPTMDELNELKYLDCVGEFHLHFSQRQRCSMPFADEDQQFSVRETFRVHAPATVSARIAVQDDIIPFGTPYTDTHGTVHETLRIRKGEMVLIPILALNRDLGIWGPDAMEFVPERWDSEPPLARTIPGIWGHMLTFLGGPKSCIGYRFSVVETKALLFTLIRAFEFELAVPVEYIGKKSTFLVQRPMVLSEREAGNQMPLLLRPVVR
ncbi:cytochrome P450 [Mycena galericulata]|nr:cytochrome P450 [Mycena galericulata]